MAGIVMQEEKVRQCKVFVVLMQGEDSCWEGSDAAVAPAKRRVCGGQEWGKGLRWGQLFIAPLPLCFYLNGQTGGGEHRRPPTLLRKQTQQRASAGDLAEPGRSNLQEGNDELQSSDFNLPPIKSLFSRSSRCIALATQKAISSCAEKS